MGEDGPPPRYMTGEAWPLYEAVRQVSSKLDLRLSTPQYLWLSCLSGGYRSVEHGILDCVVGLDLRKNESAFSIFFSRPMFYKR